MPESDAWNVGAFVTEFMCQSKTNTKKQLKFPHAATTSISLSEIVLGDTRLIWFTLKERQTEERHDLRI